MRQALVILAFVLISNPSVRADEERAAENEKEDTTWTQVKNVQPLKPPSPEENPTVVDTIYYIPTQVSSAAALVSNPINFEEHLTQQPTIALFKSMFVPGWGQAGNRRYLKAGVIIGLEAWLFSNALHYGRLAQDERDRFEAEPEAQTRDIYYGRYLKQRSQRNKYRWFLGLTVFVSMFDAYVDAHLSGAPDQVDVSKLGFEAGPDLAGGFSASLSISF